MALVNIEDWLAARGSRGAPATTGTAPNAPPASLSPDVQAFIDELRGEVARQGQLVLDLQHALATELGRNAKLVAHIRGVPPAAAAAPAGRAPSRVIRKRRRASGSAPAPTPAVVPPPPAAA
jgi:hypothetical protein